MAEEADCTIANASSLEEEMKILPLAGRLETTVWLIAGGGARIRFGEIVIPELFSNSD